MLVHDIETLYPIDLENLICPLEVIYSGPLSSDPEPMEIIVENAIRKLCNRQIPMVYSQNWNGEKFSCQLKYFVNNDDSNYFEILPVGTIVNIIYMCTYMNKHKMTSGKIVRVRDPKDISIDYFQ